MAEIHFILRSLESSSSCSPLFNTIEDTLKKDIPLSCPLLVEHPKIIHKTTIKKIFFLRKHRAYLHLLVSMLSVHHNGGVTTVVRHLVTCVQEPHYIIIFYFG